MSDVHLKAFPANEYEAVSFAYIQSKDLSSMTPEEIYKLFKETERKVYQYSQENRDAEWMRIR